jgi:hypothetical protein
VTRPPDARLDDLLTFDEDAPRRRESAAEAPWRLRAAGQAFAISAVVYTLFRAFGWAPPYLLIAAVAVAGVLVRRAVSLVAESPRFRTRELVRVPLRGRGIEPGWYEGEDGVVRAVRRWSRRLEWGSTAPERFSHTVSGRFREIVDERLRQRHGLTMASDPARARELLGEDAWTFLLEPARHIPTPRQVAEVVRRVESL